MPGVVTITRALVSVSDKTGVAEFVSKLVNHNIDLLSTGGTAKLLRDHKLPVTDVSDYTGFPEILDGRVKTLHPKIYGALLGRRNHDADVMDEHGIQPIDLVVVNFYPFIDTIAKTDCTLSDAIENIDIGGPTMIRAAAKNYQHVVVVVDADDYDRVLDELKLQNGVSLNTRYYLAQKAFAYTAGYDAAISNYLGKIKTNGEKINFPAQINFNFSKQQDLRYGENPHQTAAFYIEKDNLESSIATATQLQGKQLSFNNINDSDAALECVKQFREKPACVIVKHANPCGVAIADNQINAYQHAFATDPTSSFGGIIAFNQTVSAETAKSIIENQFVEVIIAPDISEQALDLLKHKPNVRVLVVGSFNTMPKSIDIKRVTGGVLIQDRDAITITKNDLKCVTKRTPTDNELNDLLFSWRVAAFVKSNAIVYAKNQTTIGIGAGQMSRIDSAKIAAIKASNARLNIKGAVMASDAFFPFRDGIDTATEAGITAIIQPGGSMRDKEVIQAANEANISMLFTGRRHFRH